MSLRQTGSEKVTALVNAITGLISSHNSDSNAHSTEMAKKVNVAQGTSNNGKFLKVSSGNVVCESVTIHDVSGKADKTNGALQITDSNSGDYNNINTARGVPIYDLGGATQQMINDRINLQLGYKSETTHTHSDGYSSSFLVGDGTNGILLIKINGIAIVSLNNHYKNYSATGWQTIVSTGLTNRTGQNIYASNGERKFRITSSGNLQMNIETTGTGYTGWAQIIFPYS